MSAIFCNVIFKGVGFLMEERRPFLASECDDLEKAEKWRRDIIREISKKVTQIQNRELIQ